MNQVVDRMRVPKHRSRSTPATARTAAFALAQQDRLPLAEGQAACGAFWPMGAIVVIEGDPLGPVVCNDRGWLAPHQVDRFFWREEDGWAWLAQVGGYARVQRRP